MHEFIQSILSEMKTELSGEQLEKLEAVLILKTHGMKLEKETTEVAVTDNQWHKIMLKYLACKRLENCSEGTIRSYGIALTKMFETLGKSLPDITTDDIRFYLAMYRQKRNISAGYLDTIRRYLRSFFNWANDEGYIKNNPVRQIKRVKVPQKIKKPYTPEELEKLKRTAETERDLAIIEVLYSTAGRVGEIASLNRSDVHISDRECIIYGQKGKKERRVYLTPESCYHLRIYLESRTDNNPALFVGLRSPHERLDKTAIQSMIRKLGIKCDIHAHPHKFRRTMLTDCSARGMSLQEIQAYAGHCSPETTMQYITVKEDSVKASFNKLIA